MIALTLIVHWGLPLAFALWLALGRPPSVVHYVFRVLWIATFTLTLSIAGAGWSWLGMWGRFAVMVLVAAGALAGFVRVAMKKQKLVAFETWRERIELALSFGLFTILSSGMRELGSRRTFDGAAVELAFPLPSDHRYAIVHGGRGEGINHHAVSKPQYYALDIVALNDLAARASGLTPSDPSAYAIWGLNVLSPCDGEVSFATDGLPDLVPLDLTAMDTKNPAGNHVAIFCNDVTVFLAHLQKGSVAVKVGDTVTKGAPVGRVGNSGNTTEPHLHVHAVKGRAQSLEDSEGVAMKFDRGGFLTRNDVVQ